MKRMSLVLDKDLRYRASLGSGAQSKLRDLLNFVHDVMIKINVGVDSYTSTLSRVRQTNLVQKNILEEVFVRFLCADRITFRICTPTHDSVGLEMVGYAGVNKEAVAGFSALLKEGPNQQCLCETKILKTS